jgi:hypothetical protein
VFIIANIFAKGTARKLHADKGNFASNENGEEVEMIHL